MDISRAAVQLPPLLLSACILVSVHTWGKDDISTYTVTQKHDGSSKTLVVRTRTRGDNHLLITELRSEAGEPEAEAGESEAEGQEAGAEGQEAGAQAAGGTNSVTEERRVTSIHPHPWTTSNAAGTHFHYRTDFPAGDCLNHPDDIHFIFDQWLSCSYFGSQSHGELATLKSIRRQSQVQVFDGLTRFPDFRFGVMPWLNVLDRLASRSTTPVTPELELLLPIPPIAIPALSLTGQATMEVAPSILRPVVETSDGYAFTVRGHTEWNDGSFRHHNRGRSNRGLLNRCSASLHSLVRRNRLPVTAHFTFHPENDRVQLDRLEIGEYLTITHISSGETDSQDKFVQPLLSRWEAYLKQEERLEFNGITYWEIYNKIKKMYGSPPRKISKKFTRSQLDKFFKFDAAVIMLRSSDWVFRYYHDNTHKYDPDLVFIRERHWRNWFHELSDQHSEAETEREQNLTEEPESQDDLPASNANGAASDENAAASTNNTTPLASDSSPLTGEPLPRSTLLLPDIPDTNVVPKPQ